MLDEVLKNAKPVRRVPTKKDNKNQEKFSYMLIMVHRHPEIGTIKLTVGVKSSEQHIQYGITALHPGQPLVNDTKNKKRNPRKWIALDVPLLSCVGHFTVYSNRRWWLAGEDFCTPRIHHDPHGLIILSAKLRIFSLTTKHLRHNLPFLNSFSQNIPKFCLHRSEIMLNFVGEI